MVRGTRPVLSPIFTTHTESRSDLSIPEREDYIKAVLCLQSKPPKVPKATAPGAKSRFDDFVAFHM